MVKNVICDGIYVFGFKLMNGGSVSTVLWLSNLIPLPRLVSPSYFDLLMGLSRVGILGLRDMGGEEKAVVHADSLSLPGVDIVFCLPSICVPDPENPQKYHLLSMGSRDHI